MGVISKKTKDEIFGLLVDAIEKKLEKYSPETSYMPFHEALLGEDWVKIFSILQSINTTLGMSIWEQIAVILAQGAGYHAERQYKLKGCIDENTNNLITKIHEGLREGKRDPDKYREIEEIRNSIIPCPKPRVHPDSTVDVFIRTNDGVEYYIDITTVKPNKKEFVALKRKLLTWTALRLSQDRDANVFTAIAIPYNPYYPEPYDRWTLGNLYDMKRKEVLVGKDFWDLVGGREGVYEELLGVFEKAGAYLRKRVDNFLMETSKSRR